MGKFIKVTAVIGMEIGDDADPDEVTTEFGTGLPAAVFNFPRADIWGADVVNAEPLSDEERKERGWVE